MSTSARSDSIRIRRRRSGAGAWPWTRLLATVAVLLAVAVGLGIAFAGSAATLAGGVRVDGVDVGGLTPAQARRLLDARFAEVEHVPVTFTAGGRSFRIRASELGVHPDFAAAVEAARREGDGFGPVRGYRRLHLRFFEEPERARLLVWEDALALEVARLGRAVDRAPREAALVRTGLRVAAVPAATGLALDARAAGKAILDVLGRLDRPRAPVPLPVATRPPHVAVAELQPALRAARRALSGPLRLALGPTRWRLPRWRLATLLDLPANGRRSLRLGGPAADAWFAALERAVGRPPADAGFAVDGTRVRVVPGRPGIGLDVPRSAAAILAAATAPGAARTAALVVAATRPARTTADARRMGIEGLVASYETFYGGVPNRLHNVQLVAHLLDGALVAPGKEFSFNETTGERSAAKGFLEAPVIVNGELQTGLGGGVCQVSTTVFNAAYEAGLPITARTNHALYISHYPLGRDATVDYPDVDLRFVNDTGHWLLLRTFVGAGSLVVSLYGTPQNRRVESQTAPLTVVAQAPVQRVPDPTLPKGQTVVVQAGVPATRTSVERKVYAPDGRLLSDQTWVSNYVSQPEIVDVGTKKGPKAGAATSTSTATTATTTGPTTSTTPPPQSPPPATPARG